MIIKIDYRERKLIELIKRNDEFIKKKYTLIVENLSLGDIVFTDDDGKEIILIERKSLEDLASSIMDGRYVEQSFRLNNSNIHNHNIIYLIEGDLQVYRPYSKINKQSIYSAMCNLNIYKGYSLLRTINIQETSELIIRFFDKMIREKNNIPLYKNGQGVTNNDNNKDNKQSNSSTEYVDVMKREKKSNITPENIYIIMLCQIPNISSTSAKAILEHYDYKTLLMNIDTIDFTNVKIVSNDGKERKISKKIIENLKKYLK